MTSNPSLVEVTTLRMQVNGDWQQQWKHYAQRLAQDQNITLHWVDLRILGLSSPCWSRTSDAFIWNMFIVEGNYYWSPDAQDQITQILHIFLSLLWETLICSSSFVFYCFLTTVISCHSWQDGSMLSYEAIALAVLKHCKLVQGFLFWQFILISPVG